MAGKWKLLVARSVLLGAASTVSVSVGAALYWVPRTREPPSNPRPPAFGRVYSDAAVWQRPPADSYTPSRFGTGTPDLTGTWFMRYGGWETTCYGMTEWSGFGADRVRLFETETPSFGSWGTPANDDRLRRRAEQLQQFETLKLMEPAWAARPEGGRGTAETWRFGWPWRCLDMERTHPKLAQSRATKPPEWTERHALAASYERGQKRLLIPVQPRAGALAGDVAVHAAGWVAALWASGLLVGFVRRRRGLCPGCGYEATDGGCPECGRGRVARDTSGQPAG